MPVINIKSLPVRDHISIPDVLVRLNNAVAEASHTDPEHVWSYWEYLNSGYYAVGKSVAATVHDLTHSPIIRVSCLEGKSSDEIKSILETIAKIVSKELSIDFGNVFIVYDDYKSCRVFDGGLGVQA